MEAWNQKYKKGVFIATLITIVPLLIYIHLLVSPVLNSIDLFFLKFEHSSFDVQTVLWALLNTLVPFLLLTIMFFNTIPNWKYILLPFIFLYFLNMAVAVEILPDFPEVIFSLKGFFFGLPLILVILLIDKNISARAKYITISHNVLEHLESKLNYSFKNFMNKILSTKDARLNLSTYQYLRKILYIKIALQDKYISSLTRLKQQKNKSILMSDAVIVFLFMLILFLWYIPYKIPDGIESIEIIGFVIQDHGFQDVSIFIWFVTRKLIVIAILSTWFVTCPYWWRYAILSPLIIYSYQFWEAFQNTTILDSYSNLRILPLVLINVLIVLLISHHVKYKARFLTIYEDISKEIEEIFEELKSDYSKEVVKTIENLKSKKSDHSSAVYRRQLKALEQELSARLDFKKGSLL
ncbi:MAG: hypothetical protein HKO81_10715 [Flavobacteriaceae bacterium]|nr:hypothetical protein [Flavobacteriaceae bacterium]